MFASLCQYYFPALFFLPSLASGFFFNVCFFLFFLLRSFCVCWVHNTKRPSSHLLARLFACFFFCFADVYPLFRIYCLLAMCLSLRVCMSAAGDFSHRQHWRCHLHADTEGSFFYSACAHTPTKSKRTDIFVVVAATYEFFCYDCPLPFRNEKKKKDRGSEASREWSLTKKELPQRGELDAGVHRWFTTVSFLLFLAYLHFYFISSAVVYFFHFFVFFFLFEFFSAPLPFFFGLPLVRPTFFSVHLTAFCERETALPMFPCFGVCASLSLFCPLITSTSFAVSLVWALLLLFFPLCTPAFLCVCFPY